MNIYAKYGDKVVFDKPTCGYPFDQENAKKHLTIGAEYTVNFTVVHSSRTEVYLIGFPGIHFNSVLFSDKK